MGIPGFFRWLTTAYPQAVENIQRNTQHRTDILYLDLNGLFHAALSKARKGTMTPEIMLSRVFRQMDYAIDTCKPAALVYIAMDGVAPRAKMNEQRHRRYNAVKSQDENSIKKNMTNTLSGITNDKLADISTITSNGLTFQPPSAPFYAKHTTDVKSNDISNIASFSTSLTSSTSSSFFVPIDSVNISAGTEFMHAANEAVRFYVYQRLNGRRRDLQIILNDSSVPGEGEHKIFEFLQFQLSQPGYNQDTNHVVCGGDADFIMYALGTHKANIRILRDRALVYVHVDRLRKAILKEMKPSENSLQTDDERILNDFVCISMLLGNDFIPKLRGLGMSVDVLTSTYKTKFTDIGGYITAANGRVEINRLLKLISHIGNVGFFRRFDSASSTSVDPLEATTRANDFIRTLCWSMQYYTGACPSWRFYYPHYYSPSIQDILNYVSPLLISQDFPPDNPMRPFEQLMCIIPPQCSYLLPEPFRDLLTSPLSPIKEFYPPADNISGKIHLPFIDEKRLFEAMAPKYALLCERDACKNTTKNIIEIYSGSSSESYRAVRAICQKKYEKTVLPWSLRLCGELRHCGEMASTVYSPVGKWKHITKNSAAHAEFKMIDMNVKREGRINQNVSGGKIGEDMIGIEDATDQLSNGGASSTLPRSKQVHKLCKKRKYNKSSTVSPSSTVSSISHKPASAFSANYKTKSEANLQVSGFMVQNGMVTGDVSFGGADKSHSSHVGRTYGLSGTSNVYNQETMLLPQTRDDHSMTSLFGTTWEARREPLQRQWESTQLSTPSYQETNAQTLTSVFSHTKASQSQFHRHPLHQMLLQQSQTALMNNGNDSGQSVLSDESRNERKNENYFIWKPPY